METDIIYFVVFLLVLVGMCIGIPLLYAKEERDTYLEETEKICKNASDMELKDLHDAVTKDFKNQLNYKNPVMIESKRIRLEMYHKEVKKGIQIHGAQNYLN